MEKDPLVFMPAEAQDMRFFLDNHAQVMQMQLRGQQDIRDYVVTRFKEVDVELTLEAALEHTEGREEEINLHRILDGFFEKAIAGKEFRSLLAEALGLSAQSVEPQSPQRESLALGYEPLTTLLGRLQYEKLATAGEFQALLNALRLHFPELDTDLLQRTRNYITQNDSHAVDLAAQIEPRWAQWSDEDKNNFKNGVHRVIAIRGNDLVKSAA